MRSKLTKNVTIKGKKRVANPVFWKRNIVKVMRAKRKDHTSLKKNSTTEKN